MDGLTIRRNPCSDSFSLVVEDFTHRNEDHRWGYLYYREESLAGVVVEVGVGRASPVGDSTAAAPSALAADLGSSPFAIDGFRAVPTDGLAFLLLW